MFFGHIIVEKRRIFLPPGVPFAPQPKGGHGKPCTVHDVENHVRERGFCCRRRPVAVETA